MLFLLLTRSAQRNGIVSILSKRRGKKTPRNDSNRTFCCHRENGRSTGAAPLLIRSQAALFTLHVIKIIFPLYELYEVAEKCSFDELPFFKNNILCRHRTLSDEFIEVFHEFPKGHVSAACKQLSRFAIWLEPFWKSEGQLGDKEHRCLHRFLHFFGIYAPQFYSILV